MSMDVHYSAKTVEWGTPQELFDKMNSIYGFTVDVAASHSNAKCHRYYTSEDDGLAQDWTGEVAWCNPPYGRVIKDWVRKAAESKALTVMLVPARTDTRWFHDYIYDKPNVEVEFIKGRLRFTGNPDKPLDNAPFPCMLAVFDNQEVID